MNVVDVDHALRILEGTARLVKERRAFDFVTTHHQTGPVPLDNYLRASKATDQIRNRFNREWCRCRECNGPIERKIISRQRRCLDCIEAGNGAIG